MFHGNAQLVVAIQAIAEILICVGDVVTRM